MTQSQRILRALRQGPVNSCDFQIPVCDGGKPILRVAARIQDLQDAGYGITSRRALNGTSTYTLVRDVERVSDPGAISSGGDGKDPCPSLPSFAGSLCAPTNGPASASSSDAGPSLFDDAPFRKRGSYRDAA